MKGYGYSILDCERHKQYSKYKNIVFQIGHLSIAKLQITLYSMFLTSFCYASRNIVKNDQVKQEAVNITFDEEFLFETIVCIRKMFALNFKNCKI